MRKKMFSVTIDGNYQTGKIVTTGSSIGSKTETTTGKQRHNFEREC